MFNSEKKKEADVFAQTMADVVIEKELPPPESSWRSVDSTLFAPYEEIAYRHGYEGIDYNRVPARRLAKGFESALKDRGFTRIEARIQLHKFWIYYWSMQFGDSWRLASKMTRKHKKMVDGYMSRGEV